MAQVLKQELRESIIEAAKDEFIEKFCRNCDSKCDRGMIEKTDFIRCIDRDIYVSKNAEKNN